MDQKRTRSKWDHNKLIWTKSEKNDQIKLKRSKLNQNVTKTVQSGHNSRQNPATDPMIGILSKTDDQGLFLRLFVIILDDSAGAQ